MNTLLVAVNAKFIHSNPAVYSLRAYARSEGLGAVSIAEYTINQLPADILADLYARKPDVLCFSSYIWNMDMISRLLPELPKILPGVPVFLGGPEVSYDPEAELKRFPSVSGIMAGEGEKVFVKLLRMLQREEPVPPVLAPEEVLDMDSLPFFYEEFLNEPDLGPFKNRILYYESSRGCPFRCSYCLSSVEEGVRFRSLGKVLPELEFFLERKVPQVKFIDRTFNCREGHALPIWEYLAAHDNGVTNFHFEISADLLTDRELAVLRSMRPGLVQLEIGVQSTNPATLREIRRNADLGLIFEKAHRIREVRNIHQHMDLIAGLPHEDLGSFRKSFNDLFAQAPDQLQLGFLKVLKGSYMEEKAADYGLRYLDAPPYEVLSTNWLSYGDVLTLKGVESMTELYYNSLQFTGTLPRALHAFPSPFDFFLELSRYYAGKGYKESQPSRLARYDILFDFLSERDPENRELYRETLVYDLYLRENLKTRPVFAGDLAPFKDSLRELKIEKTEHAEPFLLLDEETSGEPVFYIFDYAHRDPLSHNASVRKVTPASSRT